MENSHTVGSSKRQMNLFRPQAMHTTLQAVGSRATFTQLHKIHKVSLLGALRVECSVLIVYIN